MAEGNGASPPKKVRQIAIQRLRAGEQPFLSWGYSYVKGTQLVHDEHDPENMVEEEVEFKIPIKSVGVVEITDRLSRNAPVAPTSKKYIKKDSEEGRALNLPHHQIVIEDNLADPAYNELLRAHRQKSVYASVLAGLAMDILDEHDQLVIKSNGHNKPSEFIDEDKAIAILKGQSFSNEQFDQIYKDINALTTKEKEKVDQE